MVEGSNIAITSVVKDFTISVIIHFTYRKG